MVNFPNLRMAISLKLQPVIQVRSAVFQQ